MNIDPRRILLGAMAIAALGALVTMRLVPSPAHVEEDPVPPASTWPVIDGGDYWTRRSLLELAGFDEEDWLGDRCHEESADTYVVRAAYAPENGNHGFRDAVFDLDAGHVAFRTIPDYGPGGRDPGEVLPLIASLDAASIGRLHALLAEGGYPARTPTAMVPCSHFGRISIESCVNERYYSFIRKCFGTAEEPMVEQILDLAEARVEKRK